MHIQHHHFYFILQNVSNYVSIRFVWKDIRYKIPTYLFAYGYVLKTCDLTYEHHEEKQLTAQKQCIFRGQL